MNVLPVAFAIPVLAIAAVAKPYGAAAFTISTVYTTRRDSDILVLLNSTIRPIGPTVFDPKPL